MAGEEMIGIIDKAQVNFNAALGLDTFNKAADGFRWYYGICFTMQNNA